MIRTRRQFLKLAGIGVSGMFFDYACLGHSGATNTRPNILFFFPDQHRHDWVEMNPDLPVRTPNLARIAGQGAYFPRAVCPAPLCAPARAAVASGKEYDRCGVPTNQQNYPEEQTTFYTLLRDSGYQVMGCGKFDLRKPAMDWGRNGRHVINGVNYLHQWGFSSGIDNSGKHDGIHAFNEGKVGPYFDYLEKKNLVRMHLQDFASRSGGNYEKTFPTPLPEEAYADNWIARNGLSLIRQVPANRPWFLQVNFNGPHEPMDITRRMKERWEGTEFPQPFRNTRFPPEKHHQIRQNYSAMIENIDRWLGIYLEELEKRDELVNTLIVYASDHGEMLGDHNRWAKRLPYHPSVGIPLIIAGPGVRPGAVCQQPATTLDLAATFLDYGRISIPADMDSRSMRSLLEGTAPRMREAVFSGLESWRLVMDERYKLIRGFDPAGNQMRGQSYQSQPLVLFDLNEDPEEHINIALEAPEITARLDEMLEKHLGTLGG